MKTTDKVQIGNATIFCGNCFEVLPTLDLHADAIISDMPFGVTDCTWDTMPPLDSFWSMVEAKTKQSANYVLFGCGKFSIALVNSKPKWFRYDLIWSKNNRVGFLNANLMPMRSHEQVLVFGQPGFLREAVYNPQKTAGGRVGTKTTNHNSSVYKNKGEYVHHHDGTLHPSSVLQFKSEKDKGLHPTLKPLALMEFLVRSYTNENDIVVDPFMGSGSTAIACVNTGRKFIGVEKEKAYFDVAVQRLEEAYAALE